jgi:UDP-2,4-diacetamido-2,4,6-trideoxy-beta-L-altropyranose hydrolase
MINEVIFNKIIIFFCEASLENGTGHVMRCLTMANMLKKNDNKCIFVTSLISKELIPQLNNFEIISPDNFIENPMNCDLIIIDNYKIDNEFEKKLRNFTKKIMVIDDLFNRKHDCDILLDQNFGVKKIFYKNLVNKDCKILLGTKYAILRPEFLEYRRKIFHKRKLTKNINNLLINFGGSDVKNYSLKALKMAEKSSFKGEINVVLGFSSPNLESIKKFSKISKNKINILQQANMAQMIFEADIAIAAGGSSTWERCCLGLPTYMIKIADNQSRIFEELGQKISFKNFLVEVAKNYNDLAKKYARYVDGKGLMRTIRFLEKSGII